MRCKGWLKPLCRLPEVLLCVQSKVVELIIWTQKIMQIDDKAA